jgi:hypothetical protein
LPTPHHITLFALDCGATNWRLYRTSYQASEGGVRMVGEPQSAPLTSFADRTLPAAILLNEDGSDLEGIGEVAYQRLEDEKLRQRVRVSFKPSIGVHLETAPLPHQKRYTHEEAIGYTGMLLKAVLDQVHQEKWRAGQFDERVYFTFAYPIHWGRAHNGQVLADFKQMVFNCLPENIHSQVRFVPEPEGALLNLQRQGLLGRAGSVGPQETVTLVVDVGGSTTDIAAGQVNTGSGRLVYLGHYGAPFGGATYDAQLSKWLAEELGVSDAALAEDLPAVMGLRLSAQRLKESLSRQMLQTGSADPPPTRAVTLVMGNGTIYRKVVTLSHKAFEGQTAGLQEVFEKHIDEALMCMGLSSNRIGQVLLVGGGAQLYTIVGHLRDRFGRQRVLLADNPAEIVAHGIGLEFGAALGAPVTPAGPTPAENKKANQLAGWALSAESGKVYKLKQGANKIGRDEGSDVQILVSRISRLHAEMRVEGERVSVVDLDSTNGTFVSGKRIVSNYNHLLPPGEVVQFGSEQFTLIQESE